MEETPVDPSDPTKPSTAPVSEPDQSQQGDGDHVEGDKIVQPEGDE